MQKGNDTNLHNSLIKNCHLEICELEDASKLWKNNYYRLVCSFILSLTSCEIIKMEPKAETNNRKLIKVVIT